MHIGACVQVVWRWKDAEDRCHTQSLCVPQGNSKIGLSMSFATTLMMTSTRPSSIGLTWSTPLFDCAKHWGAILFNSDHQNLDLQTARTFLEACTGCMRTCFLNLWENKQWTLDNVLHLHLCCRHAALLPAMWLVQPELPAQQTIGYCPAFSCAHLCCEVNLRDQL